MKTVHGYVLPIISIHVSLLIGALSYVLRDVDQNRLAGLRTPATLRNPEIWKRANQQVATVMPWISGACIAVASLGFWIDVLRTGLAFLIIIGIQVAVLIGFTVEWWSPSRSSLRLLQEQEDNDAGQRQSHQRKVRRCPR